MPDRPITDALLIFNDQTGTSYTMQLLDNSMVVTFTNASPITVTLPNSFPKGWSCMVFQLGVGQVTFALASGATMPHDFSHTKLRARYSSAALVVTSNAGGTAAVYNLSGDTA